MHTLNEQSTVITGDTVAEAVDNLKSWLATTFGWELSNGVLYPRDDKKLGITFDLGSTTLRIYAVNVWDTTTTNSQSTSVTTSINVWYHVSAGESVKYIRVGSGTSTGIAFIIAEANDGELYAFVTGTTTNPWDMLSENAHTMVAAGYETPVNQLLHFSTTKFPAFVNGGEMKELFMVTSARTFSPMGFNVEFPNAVHRLVTVKGGTSAAPQFSFPVGD